MSLTSLLAAEAAGGKAAMEQSKVVTGGGEVCAAKGRRPRKNLVTFVRQAHDGLVNAAIRLSSVGIDQPSDVPDSEASTCTATTAGVNVKRRVEPGVEVSQLR